METEKCLGACECAVCSLPIVSVPRAFLPRRVRGVPRKAAASKHHSTAPSATDLPILYMMATPSMHVAASYAAASPTLMVDAAEKGPASPPSARSHHAGSRAAVVARRSLPARGGSPGAGACAGPRAAPRAVRRHTARKEGCPKQAARALSHASAAAARRRRARVERAAGGGGGVAAVGGGGRVASVARKNSRDPSSL